MHARIMMIMMLLIMHHIYNIICLCTGCLSKHADPPAPANKTTPFASAFALQS